MKYISLLLVAFLAILTIAGCGQKGPLYLPQPETQNTKTTNSK
ncbi:lipoprotein [Legionella lytica]|uniref:Lipoprotein n=1 Tax=Legionella lytica TaxID=96232 RepID=A0ABY4Y9F5_9GAMM|nr:lipoprotein [Legionella lytica]USQ14061.1 lipoprotein [Legionella lytica]